MRANSGTGRRRWKLKRCVNSANSEAVAADDGIEPEVTLDQARATIPEEGANKMVWKIKNEVDMHEDPRDRGRPQMVTLRASPTPAIRARLKPTELRFNNRYTAITAYVSGNNPKGILPPIFCNRATLRARCRQVVFGFILTASEKTSIFG